MLPRPVAGILLGLLLAAGAAAQAALIPATAPPKSPERGFPLIQTYDPALPEAETQSFGIVRDPRGVLYVANLGGVLVYDGAWWQIIPVGREKMVFALASDARGSVAAGGSDELGLLTPDAAGTLRFVSLRDRLPAAQRDFGQVLSIQAIPGSPGGFAFMTARWLLLWDGARFTTAATFTGERPYAEPFLVGSKLYVWTRDAGLCRLAGARLAPVPGGEVFRGRRIDQLLAAGAAEADGLLVSVRGEGLFRFRDGKAAPFAPEASRWTAAKRVVDGCRLADGRWALGSVLGGLLLLLRPDGGIDQVIDTAAGLNDDYVSGLVVDREGSLWASLNSGLARIEVASPLSVLDRRSGLQGSVYSLARHQGTLWVGTAVGVFTTAETRGGPASGPTARLHAVPGLPPAAWSLLSIDDDLLVGMAFGVYVIGKSPAHPDGAPRRVPGTPEKTTYTLTRSRAEPSRVWLGTEEGLTAIRRAADAGAHGGEWRFEANVAGVPQEVRSIVEGKDGVLWCSTNGGTLRIELPPGGPGAGTPRISKVRGGSPDGDGELIRAGDRRDRILAASGDRILRLDEARGELVPDPALARFAGQRFDRLAADAGGNLWRNTHPPTLLVRRGEGWAPEPRSLPEVTAHGIEFIVAEPDGVVWLATESGLLRYLGSSAGSRDPAAPLPPPRIARVTSGGGKLLFGGEPGGVHTGAPVLPYDGRRLRIEFAPLSFRAGLRYRTWLSPLDAGWSAPTAEPFAELARVPPGDYTFRVRTIGPGGEAGPEASWPFHVRPPWYRTGWALALWAGLAIAAVLAYVRLRGRALHQRAERLEARVAEQTVELRHTVQELRRAHADLAAANGRLEELSLRDELTGIANRRRLQLALDEEWRRSWRSIAFILVDLDEFKRLNDTRGHLAGDLGLQAVAAFLEEAARRHGTLAARYGGEELAMLLPGATLAAAADVAEELRRGIEALAIPNPAAALGHLTASFGVAALAPTAGEPPAELIAAADRALYRAKSEGRNRVCTSADAALPVLPTTDAS